MRPKVGLALGAGAALGFCHIGVLKVLKREGIPVDMIAGTSMGAMVGALYSCGVPLDVMEKLFANIGRRHWVDISLKEMGLIAGNKILSILRTLTRDLSFEDLEVPLRVTAVDIERAEEVVIGGGNVAEAVRASIAIPGIFSPVRREGRLLVDGGILDRVPVSVVREMGADVIIAVNVGHHLRGFYQPVRGIFNLILQTIEVMQREITRYKVIDADVIIEPDVSELSSTNFSAVDAFVSSGEEAASGALSEIKRKILEADS